MLQAFGEYKKSKNNKSVVKVFG